MGLPHDVERGHLLAAMKEIDDGHIVVPESRKSTKFDLRYAGHSYPPKFLICVAHKCVDGIEAPNTFGGGPEANNFLIAKGFEVWNKVTGAKVGIEAEEESEESAFPEGRAMYIKHRKLERDSRIAKTAKNKRLLEVNDLKCDACNFSFRDRYGDLGVGYIEAHHTVPVSELKGRRKTKLSEIALVCSNCHRMLHRSRPWLSIASLRDKISSPATQ